jgi:hypothetical protein
MAQAAPPPVDVTLPPGPVSPFSPILVDANDAVVTNLAIVAVGNVGGVPRVSLTQGEALCAFGIKCKLDRSPADPLAMGPINILTLRLTTGAWSRILTAVRDNGLAARNVRVLEELHEYMRMSVPLVAVTAIDW